jgi:hypothetical protein
VAKPEKRRRWRKKRTGFGAAVGFLREYEQKKTGTARGSVTRLTMPLVQAGQGEPFKHCSGSAFLLLETRLKLRGEVGGKACEAPPVAEEANRVWRSGRLFARIRAEKDGNRKRKRDTAHDAVGSSRDRGSHSSTAQAVLFCCLKHA